MNQESRMTLTSARNGVRNRATSLVMSKEVSCEEEGKPASKMCSYVYRRPSTQWLPWGNSSAAVIVRDSSRSFRVELAARALPRVLTLLSVFR